MKVSPTRFAPDSEPRVENLAMVTLCLAMAAVLYFIFDHAADQDTRSWRGVLWLSGTMVLGILAAHLGPFLEVRTNLWRHLPGEVRAWILAVIRRNEVRRQRFGTEVLPRRFEEFNKGFRPDPADPRPDCEQAWAAFCRSSRRPKTEFQMAQAEARLSARSRLAQIEGGMPACSSSREAKIYLLARFCRLARELEGLGDPILQYELAGPLAAAARALGVGAPDDDALALAALSRAGGGRASVDGWCNPENYFTEFLEGLLEARKMPAYWSWEAAFELLVHRELEGERLTAAASR